MLIKHTVDRTSENVSHVKHITDIAFSHYGDVITATAMNIGRA